MQVSWRSEKTSWSLPLKYNKLDNYNSTQKHVWEINAMSHPKVGEFNRESREGRTGRKDRDENCRHSPGLSRSYWMWEQWKVRLQRHSADRGGRDSILVWVTSTHWGWAQQQGWSSNINAGGCRWAAAITKEKKPQTWKFPLPHTNLPYSTQLSQTGQHWRQVMKE